MLETISPTRSLSTRLALFTIATAITAMLGLTMLTNAAATEHTIATARHQIDT
jgi:hypothetical protein